MKNLLFISLLFLSFTSYSSSSFESDEINITGEFSRRPSAAERTKILRRKLERRTEQLVKKQIQTIRLQKELELQRKLKVMFDKQMKAIESIN